MEKREESASGFRKVRGGGAASGLYEVPCANHRPGARRCPPPCGAAGARFPRCAETVNKILHLHFKDDKTRVSSDALLLMAEMLNVFVREAAARSARQAQAEELDRVDIEHVEKVLPQLLLDF
ncbi:prothymosin alpha [Platysternon megacephalum]|uniref:Centromere protein X n=1 Tax=Platysternon megacephalum TaxID=55544 RepID=A0A4D9E7R7_9SAUR|nr:prothymosin alpha [Platysternon megacephalum]